MDNLILPREQYILLYGSSHLSLISFLYAMSKGEYIISTGVISVFLTSINYWRKPDHSWRRQLDITVSAVGITYQRYVAYHAENFIPYAIIYTTAVTLFFLGKEFYRRGDTWKSTYTHLAFHILCNVANLVLYSGNMRVHNFPNLN